MKIAMALVAAVAAAAPAGQRVMPQDLARVVATYDAATVSNDGLKFP